MPASMPAPTIYYIRHGETAWNAEGRFQGIAGYPAQRARPQPGGRCRRNPGRLLARDGHEAAALPFVASPLGRAGMTMELVRGALKLPAAGYSVDDRLREIGYGQWEGSDAAGNAGSMTPRLSRCAQADKWTVSPRRRARAMPASRCGCATGSIRCTADTVAVAHGGTMRALMVALGIATPDRGRRDRRSGRAWSTCSATAGCRNIVKAAVMPGLVRIHLPQCDGRDECVRRLTLLRALRHVIR